MGDSWFGCVDVVVYTKREFDTDFVGVVKNSHRKYPKEYLEKTMAEWPGGSHLVLEATIGGVDVVACSYKYNKKKVNCFVFTKGAGHTEPGEPYEVKWKDDNGNTRHRDVPRPDVVAKYFKNSNVIDVHNQSRQFDLRLEKHWVTENGYFRLVTTMFGIVVTDCWRAYRFHLHSNHRHKGMEVQEFAKILAKDMLDNKYTATAEVDEAFSIFTTDNNDLTSYVVNVPHGSDSPSTTTNDFQSATNSFNRTIVSDELTLRQQQLLKHTAVKCNEKVRHSVTEQNKVRTGVRARRGKCIMCGGNTSFYCSGCPPSAKRIKPWCCAHTEKGCFNKHIEQVIERAGEQQP